MAVTLKAIVEGRVRERSFFEKYVDLRYSGLGKPTGAGWHVVGQTALS